MTLNSENWNCFQLTFTPFVSIGHTCFLGKQSYDVQYKNGVEMKNKEIKQKVLLLEQKMNKSPNKNKSHFLYRREQMIRYKMIMNDLSQKQLAKSLKLTESYISKLITGERYNKDFEFFMRKYFQLDYCFI